MTTSIQLVSWTHIGFATGKGIKILMSKMKKAKRLQPKSAQNDIVPAVLSKHRLMQRQADKDC
jgi:hypothetical protein